MRSQKLRPADYHGRHLIPSIVARQRIGFDVIFLLANIYNATINNNIDFILSYIIIIRRVLIMKTFSMCFGSIHSIILFNNNLTATNSVNHRPIRSATHGGRRDNE